MKNGVEQSRDDLEKQLEEQIGFLKSSADAYDSGNESEFKRLALTLRILLHNGGCSKSLIGQLGKLDIPFLSTAFPLSPKHQGPHEGLPAVALAGKETRYVAMLDDGPMLRWIPFSEWWNDTIFRDAHGRTTTRKEMVLAVADQDGGAHVDPKLEPKYAELSRDNSQGWRIRQGAASSPVPNPGKAAVRQIAHETLKSLISGYQCQPNLEARGLVGGLRKITSSKPLHATTKIGRNALCPCGSGKKYKNCCGPAPWLEFPSPPPGFKGAARLRPPGNPPHRKDHK